jgi:biopolymer transport protein ExbD
MSKSVFHVMLALVACLVLTATASAKKFNSSKTPSPRKADAASKDAITLEITGPADAQAIAAYQKALGSSGLPAKIHEGKKGEKPLKVMAAVDTKTDLGPFGKAVMTAVPTKPGQMPPALELMIYAPLTKETSQRAMAQLEKVKGVDAKHSTMDVKKGSLRVRISGAEHVTAEDVMKAVQSAGVVPTLAREGHAKKA